MACTIAKSCLSTDWTSSDPIPFRPNADSTTALETSSPATSRPVIVRIGPSALRRTCRRTTVPLRHPAAQRHLDVLAAELVEHGRARHPGDQGDERQRQRDRGQEQVVELVAEAPGRHRRSGTSPAAPRSTEISKIAATNDGIAASTVLTTSTALSATARPCSAPMIPAVSPNTQMSTADNAIRPRVVGIRAPISERDVLPELQRPPEVEVEHPGEPVPVLHEERAGRARTAPTPQPPSRAWGCAPGAGSSSGHRAPGRARRRRGTR